ncbi:hypothetical protein [Roseibacillus ishigakijimensis]|uniref:Uncharacterized protein n=1 Tax=Roseibacillus ishigakijimensis TaxID=454146 RepID=A0A934RNE4_9BACT|nr:hypothetical protein [Roseibacillus ishigakijimensis]MBK1832513.1 hypothetical protein [Roseibacillus ishigakijimensis]
MSVLLKCAACGHQVPFQDGELTTEAICPGCEVLLRRRSLDDLMAIPVSMALPDRFEPADLNRVPKHTRELIHRYRKEPGRAGKTGDPLSDSNLVLAQAIERLAFAIEGKGLPGTPTQAGEESFQPQRTSFNATAPQTGEAAQGHTQERGANGKTAAVSESGKALPVGAPVLVRREAAAEAHRFQRRTQADTDVKGPQKSSLNRWVEDHPLTMMLLGLAALIALVVMTTILMNQMDDREQAREAFTPTMSQEAQGADPDFAHAEREARGFLNAIALNPAKPYIYQADAILPKLERFYQPLPDPANYTLQLKSRQQLENRAVYIYHVTSSNRTQPLVVLQEDSRFKVFWEFGAGVGDLSWEAFLTDEPSEAVLMRAFLRPEPTANAAYPANTWSSWLAENWDGSQSARVFARRDSPEHRRLQAAYESHPVKRRSSSWVMAQVRLKHSGMGINAAEGSYDSAEVVEVPLGSWLPEEYVVGDTIYSAKDKLKPSKENNQGLPDRETF